METPKGWRRLAQILLIPFVLPPTILFMLALVSFFFIWNGSAYLIYWTRFKLFGEPIPSKYPPPP